MGMTLRELNERTRSWFEGLGLPSARLDAELLIAHALQIDRMTFYTDATRPLSDEEVDACRALVRRRGKREPIAYILGTREFFSREFAVDSRVLIPRPDTEVLVEVALELLGEGRGAGRREGDAPPPPEGDEPEHAPRYGQRIPGMESTVEYDEPSRSGSGEVEIELDPELVVEPEPAPEREPASASPPSDAGAPPPPSAEADDGLVLDYGTGSGAIAITLAAERPGLRVLALDLSADALAVAKANAASHGLEERVGFVPSDGFSRVPPRFRGQLRGIIANPPYIPQGDAASLSADVREHEPHGALFAGPDWALHYRRLASEGGSWLRRGGFLAVEVGAGQAETVRGLLRSAGWTQIQTRRDLASIERVVFARWDR